MTETYHSKEFWERRAAERRQWWRDVGIVCNECGEIIDDGLVVFHPDENGSYHMTCSHKVTERHPNGIKATFNKLFARRLKGELEKRLLPEARQLFGVGNGGGAND